MICFHIDPYCKLKVYLWLDNRSNYIFKFKWFGWTSNEKGKVVQFVLFWEHMYTLDGIVWRLLIISVGILVLDIWLYFHWWYYVQYQNDGTWHSIFYSILPPLSFISFLEWALCNIFVCCIWGALFLDIHLMFKT